MEPGTIELFLSDNADLHTVLPVIDENGAGVDMTGWPFKMELKFDEMDAVSKLTVTVVVQGVGELLLTATKANIAAIWPVASLRKKLALVGDLLTKPNNGTYTARIGEVKATAVKGVSTL
jgi:hypothetical protein